MKKTLVLLMTFVLTFSGMAEAKLLLKIPLKGDTKPSPESVLTDLKVIEKNITFDVDGHAIFSGFSYISVTGHDLMLKKFTVTLWLKHKPTKHYGRSSIFRLPGGNGHNAGGRYWAKRQAGTAVLYWGMKNKLGPKSMKIGSIFDGKYNFLALTVDGPEVKAYINGKLAVERRMPGEIQYKYDKEDFLLNLGVCHFPKLQGSISDFRIYDKPLSVELLKKLYLEQQKNYLPQAGKVLKKKLIIKSNLQSYPSDKLKVVTGSDGINLLQNPSFETGLGYWKGLVTGATLKPYHAGVSKKESASGKHSAFIKVWKNDFETGLGSFAVKVTPGETYTFSFQAKADQTTKLLARIVSGSWPVFPVSTYINIGTKWKHYKFTFTAPNNLAQPYFAGLRKPNYNTTIYIDAVQLKKGKAITFSEPPFCSGLSTKKFGNIFAPGEKITATLNVFIPQSKNGTVMLSGYNFFKQELFKSKLKLSPNTSGYADIPLDLTGKLVNGINLLRADFKLFDGRTFTDFYRISILPPRDENFRPPHFFGMGGINCFPDAEKPFNLFREFGFRAILGFGRVHSPLLSKQFSKNGFISMSSVFSGGDNSREWKYESQRKNGGTVYDVKKNYKTLTQEQFNEVIKRVYDKVRANPHITYWKLINEIGPTHVNDKNIGPFFKLCRAAAKAIKKANPNAKVISLDETNIYMTSGMRIIDKLFKAGMGDFIDILSIHPYRPHPDALDLDQDLSNLFSILDKHGFKGKVWSTENMNYTSYEIPAIGWEVSGHASADNARGQSFSYDIGFGERLGSAYRARTFLIMLKYASRIDVCCDWTANSSNYLLDANGTPRAMGFAVNTLARLFSRAEYAEDVAISDELRCYLFRSNTSMITALWNRDREIDNGKKTKTAVYIPFTNDEVNIIDLMGNPVSFSKSERLAIGSAPIFFQSKNIKDNTFLEKMRNIRQEGGQSRKLIVRENILSPEKINLVLTANSGKALSGRLLYSINGHIMFDAKVDLPSQGSKTFEFVLPKAVKTVGNLKTAVKFKITDGNVLNYQQNIMLIVSHSNTTPIKIDGNLSDWKTPGIKLTNEVSSFRKNLPKNLRKTPDATFYSCWDNKYLYLAFKVKSPTYSPPISSKGYWNGDSLQIYFDTENDAKYALSKRFDNDDYVYGVFASQSGQTTVLRDVVPEWQLCFLRKGLAPEVKRAFRRTSDGYVYELAFPIESLPPILFEKNRVYGFSALVNCMIDGVRLGRTLMPNTVEPYNNTNKWPIMILAK